MQEMRIGPFNDAQLLWILAFTSSVLQEGIVRGHRKGRLCPLWRDSYWEWLRFFTARILVGKFVAGWVAMKWSNANILFEDLFSGFLPTDSF
ncbi:hypothetical protein CIPAW_16G012700 [Carya illinoinensis]|uniref:Uncharacterized protein n=1 Tax=Carya illinoinensis TaxID=32201 RepID=A0A8T1N398_CARIL|nr:hypothetical protein CIPAW_16G012700 [Carya illinoinensis]